MTLLVVARTTVDGVRVFPRQSAVRDLEEECRVKEAAAVTALEDENKPKTLVQVTDVPLGG